MARLLSLICLLALVSVGCSSAPPADGLRDSFAQQLAANRFVSDLQRSGDNITFKGPRPDGTPSFWRVHIDTATVQSQSNEAQPYKGTIAASWYVDGEQVVITGGDSNLPLELTSNGLGQECWAYWNPETTRWDWE